MDFPRPDGSIDLVPYDSHWPAEFERMKTNLVRVVPAIQVHHVGSTSVPGLPSKPTIDLLVVFSPDIELPMMIEQFGQLGLDHRPGSFANRSVTHLFFRKVNASGKRTHHVHALPVGSSGAADMLLLRDYLRANPDEASNYAAVKDRLVQIRDRKYYVEEKSKYVDQLMIRVRAWNSTH